MIGQPSAPLNLEAKIVLSSSITIAWDRPDDLGGSVELQYTVVINNSNSGDSKAVDGITVTDYTFLDLAPRTQYLISVVAMNDVSIFLDSLAASTATILATTLPFGKFLGPHPTCRNSTSCPIPQKDSYFCSL